MVLYSALDAPLVWISILPPALLMLIGAALLWASWRRKCWINGISGTPGLLVQFVVGAIFLSLGGSFTVSKWTATVDCWNALRAGDVTVVAGKLAIVKVVEARATGYIRFRVGERSFSTQTKGAVCDCGHIQPLGEHVRAAVNATVRVKLRNGAVVSLEKLD